MLVLVFLGCLNLEAKKEENLGSAVLLQYHRFGEKQYPSTDVSMELFTKQIEYLVQHNYNIFPLSKIVQYLQEKKPLPEKTVAITIDDAYKSVYTNAYPLLKKYHIPFTVFVNSLPVIHKSKNFMSWDEMLEMGKSGAEFANHTYSHQFLVRIDEKKALQEIMRCQTTLEKKLGKYVLTKPKMLAYPFGEYDERLMDMIRDMGYIGIAQNSGPVSYKSDLAALTRFPMSGGFGKMESFVLKLNTLPLDVVSVSTKKTLVTKQNNPPKFSITLEHKHKDLRCFTSNGQEIVLKNISPFEVQMQAYSKLLYPRDHYTCTAWASRGKWYWFSHMWVVLKNKK